jgi:hypothetical protein
MKISLKKKLAAAAVAVTVVGGASAAFAYWTTSGTGTGLATAGTSTAVDVDQVGSVTNLYPGSPAQPVDFKITNTTANNQYIASVAVSVASVSGVNIDATHPCTPGDFTVVQPNPIATDLTPGAHTYSASGATLSLNNTGANQDGCKLATAHLAFAAS